MADGLPQRGGQLLDGRYRLRERIGEGGMSVVWRAWDERLDRDVAVKLLGDAGNERFRSRIRGEAKASGQLNHPRIAHIYDVGETTVDGETIPYMVMEYVDGEQLSLRMAGGRALPWSQATTIAAQIAEALAAAHARGLVHRDIKPPNVMLTVDGVKLIDFGISAPIGAPESEDDGELLGTAAYLAPERLVDAPVGPASDVYALGVLLYQMLTGVLPWRFDGPTGLLEAHLLTDPDPLPPIGGRPDGLDGLCRGCLDKDPDRRPSAAEVNRYLVGLTAAARPARHAVGGRRRGRRAAVVLSVAGGLAVLTAAWAGGGEPNPAAADARSAACVAQFAIVRDWGAGFDGLLRITNTSRSDLPSWQVGFSFPGDQRLSADDALPVGGASPARIAQSGAVVTVDGPAGVPLRVGQAVDLPIHAGYRDANPLPTAYTLNGRPCRTQVAGAVTTPTHTGSTIRPPATGAPVPTGGPTTTPPTTAPSPAPMFTPTSGPTAEPTYSPTPPPSPTTEPPTTGSPDPSPSVCLTTPGHSSPKPLHCHK